VTCSDEGRLGEVVLEAPDDTGQALVRTAKGEEWIDVSMVSPDFPHVAPDDLVLIHAGAAITRLESEVGR
jgi:hypothetical protein